MAALCSTFFSQGGKTKKSRVFGQVITLRHPNQSPAPGARHAYVNYDIIDLDPGQILLYLINEWDASLPQGNF